MNHTDRCTVRDMLAQLTAPSQYGLRFDDRGVCQSRGKFEGCYESTVYFHLCGLEGAAPEGFISRDDGWSATAWRPTEQERCMMAGPWDWDGSVQGRDDVLYVIIESSDGGVGGSFMGEDQWTELLAADETEDA